MFYPILGDTSSFMTRTARVGVTEGMGSMLDYYYKKLADVDNEFRRIMDKNGEI